MSKRFSISLAIAFFAMLSCSNTWAAQIPTGVVQDKAKSTTNPSKYAQLPIGFHWKLLDKHHAEIYFDQPNTVQDYNYLVSTASNFRTYNALLTRYSDGVASAVNRWVLNNQPLLFTVKCSGTKCTGSLRYKKVCIDKTCTLPDEFANLTLTGSSSLNGTGNANDNKITGNSASNTLDGRAGNDKLKGGAGKDTLTDEEGNNTLEGGSGNDILTAGPGNDSLNGGSGNDSLSGGFGNDRFKFGSTPSAKTNLDRITDFTPGNDQILLRTTVFKIPHKYMGKQLGTITETSRLESGPGLVSASNPATRLIYDTTSGAVYYDADGSGSTEAIQFIVLENQPVISITDFALYK